VENLGLKPRLAFGPVRTAVSGRRISPPLFESMVILGRESSLRRLRVFRG
jgi:glutamyl-tRNA synthetase